LGPSRSLRIRYIIIHTHNFNNYNINNINIKNNHKNTIFVNNILKKKKIKNFVLRVVQKSFFAT